MNWLEALQVFVAVTEKKSFSAAAKALHMPTSKVSKLIQWLEHRLKTTLLIRTTRKVTLTEQGEYLFQRANNLLEEWNALYTHLTDQEQSPSGLLTIATLPDLLNSQPFIGWLVEFLNAYPDICLETITIHRPFILSQSEADLFIGRDYHVIDTSDIISKKIFSFNYGIYASPLYLKNHGDIKFPADLVEHNCLTAFGGNEWAFTNGIQKVRGNHIADNSSILLALATEGAGIVRVPYFRAKPYVDTKQLTPILEKYTLNSNPMSCNIYYKKLPYQPQKIKLFVEHILKKSK